LRRRYCYGLHRVNWGVNVKWFYLVLNSVALNKYKPIDN